MPRTHLPGHLDSAREKIRPRHQLLVLKCYPRLPKNATADARPNSSELSYLLYYGSTRQNKLPKLGAFLEQKTAHDVYRWQSARVHVTLQILTAILEHKEIGGRVSGFVLIAPYVLRIIREIINATNDISLIEATTETWNVFCQYQDVATLAADSEYRALYEEVIRLYASLAKNTAKKLAKSTQPVAHHDATRLRKAGVVATKSVFAPSDSDRRWTSDFTHSFAAILSNLRHASQNAEQPHDYLEHLISLSKKNEEEERPSPVNRRQSIATMRTFSGLVDEQDLDPRAAEGTAQDADRLEEEEVGTMALDCLKAIFQSQNRAQVRGGAIAFMSYIADEEQRYVSGSTPASVESWASMLFRLITSWAPVQDRFILIVTAVETLVRFPLEKSRNIRVAVLYAKVILSVLRSDLNLVGLSVIDILLGLITQTVRTIAIVSGSAGSTTEIDRTATSSSQKQAAHELIPHLKDCMSNLARHVYYSDQVTDLISFILLRVKPDPSPARPRSSSEQERPITAAAATLDPKASTNDTASSISRPHTQGTTSVRSGIFSSEDGRRIALETIQDIIDVARSTYQYSAGSAVINRNRVPLGVWEGSQWVSRDPSDAVRKAYRSALLMWARYEAEEGDEALIDFEAEDCIEKLAEKKKPASVHGSMNQSHRSAHPQLLMLPTFGAERRMSSGKNSSNGTEDAAKPRVRATDLKDIVQGKRQVPIKMGNDEPLDVTALLATIKIDPSRNGLSMAPPY